MKEVFHCPTKTSTQDLGEFIPGATGDLLDGIKLTEQLPGFLLPQTWVIILSKGATCWQENSKSYLAIGGQHGECLCEGADHFCLRSSFDTWMGWIGGKQAVIVVRFELADPRWRSEWLCWTSRELSSVGTLGNIAPSTATWWTARSTSASCSCSIEQIAGSSS